MRFKGRLAERPHIQIQGLLVLLVLYHLGGKVTSARVLDYLEKILAPALEPGDIEPEYRGTTRVSAHRWHHAIHATLAHSNAGLRARGYLLPTAKTDHGVWAISDKGRQRIQSLCQEGRDPVSKITLEELTTSLDIPFLKEHTIAPSPSQELLSIVPKPGRKPRESVVVNGGTPQVAILAQEIANIREFLNGNGAQERSDETLCDWIWFCYKFELYAEGAALFKYIHPEFVVNHWFYERTKKLADACAIRKE